MQLMEMVRLGVKADIEALYHGSGGMAGLTQTMLRAVLRREFV
jgi:hypothetical protein